MGCRNASRQSHARSSGMRRRSSYVHPFPVLIGLSSRSPQDTRSTAAILVGGECSCPFAPRSTPPLLDIRFLSPPPSPSACLCVPRDHRADQMLVFPLPFLRSVVICARHRHRISAHTHLAGAATSPRRHPAHAPAERQRYLSPRRRVRVRVDGLRRANAAVRSEGSPVLWRVGEVACG